MTYGLIVLCGALICNCLPHLSFGLSGAPFPTPFAKPSGIGNSSALTNFLWGAFNLFLAVLIASREVETIETGPGIAALAVGFLLLGVYLSLHFAKVRAPA